MLAHTWSGPLAATVAPRGLPTTGCTPTGAIAEPQRPCLIGFSMRSLRSRLLALWIMLVVSGGATAYLLFESFQQTSNARVARSEELVARACRDIADRFQFFVSGWTGGQIDDRLKQDLGTLVQATLSSAVGVEGGVWQADIGSLAYAFPSYEGTGPKTDLPAAELNTIREVNAEAL